MTGHAFSRRAWLLAVVAIAVAPAASRAHFLWMIAEREGGKTVVLAFLNEPPLVDSPEFLKFIDNATYAVTGRPVKATRGADSFAIEVGEPTPDVVDGACDLGVSNRGGTPIRLEYTARVQLRPISGDVVERADKLRVALVATADGPPRARVWFDGKPLADAVVKRYLEDGTTVEVKADAEGWLDAPGVAEGKVGLLARWADGKPGELAGKPFTETRYYATLTLPNAEEADLADPKSAATATPAYAPIPEALNSFGGAVAGDWLYVYSGHIGRVHRYHQGTTSKHFRRLSLDDRTTWEELPAGPSLQGVAMVEHRGQLYRIGGMSARNAEGTPEDLVSVADFARYDPATRTWTDLPPLPSPRSTHDAAVIGDTLYVVGGWNMRGGDSTNAEWLEGGYRFDLADPSAQWLAMAKPPFVRRALAAGSAGGKLYVLGGLTDDGSVVLDVDVYDPAAKSWSKGPAIPGPKFQGFAPSAFEVGGRLYLSGVDGNVYALSGGADAWEPIGKLAVPRLTHRLLPGRSGELLAVGGTFGGAPIPFVESVAIGRAEPGPKALAWSARYEGAAHQSQAIGFARSRVILAGGNLSDEPHAFEPANFTAEVVGYFLGTAEGESLRPLPSPRQSGQFVAPPGDRDAAYLLGGIGPDGDGVVRTLGEIHRLDLKTGDWSRLGARIPDDRGMFGAVAHEGRIWIAGGSIWDPRAGDDRPPMPLDLLAWKPGGEGGFEPTGHALPRARRSFAGAVMGSKYFLVGGLGEDMKIVDDVDVFDFESSEWSTIPAPSKPRLFADLAAIGGKLYLAGGFARSEESHFAPEPTVEVFDPASGRWSTAMSEPPVPGKGVRMFALQDRLLFVAIDAGAGRAHFAIVAP